MIFVIVGILSFYLGLSALKRFAPEGLSGLKPGVAAGLGCALVLSLAACSPTGIQFQPLPATQPGAEEPAAPATLKEEAKPAPPTSVVESILKGASLLSQRALNDMDFLVVIQTLEKLPEGSAASVTVTVNDKPYRCALLEQFTNRLYCVGEPPQAEKEAVVKAFAADPLKPAFEGQFTPQKMNVPAQPSPVKVDAPADASPTPAATEGPTGGGGEEAGSGLQVIQPGGSIGGGMEEMGGGIAPTATPGAQDAAAEPTATP